MILTFDTEKFMMVILYPLPEVWEKLGQGERNYCQGFITEVCLDIETWFKVFWVPLLKGILLIKSEQDYAKGREIMIQNWILKRSAIMTFTFDLKTMVQGHYKPVANKHS